MDERNVNVERDIEKLNLNIKDDTNSLHSFLKRITYNLSFLDEDDFTDKILKYIVNVINYFRVISEGLLFNFPATLESLRSDFKLRLENR